MARVVVAALVALIISLLAGPVFIDFLRRNSLGQTIREEGPEHHSAKQGTPTMGGVLIVVAAAIAYLATGDLTSQALTILGVTVACGGIGFFDDLTKLRHRRSLGLSGRAKMLLLLGIAAAVSIAAHHDQLNHSVFIPIVDYNLQLGDGWYVLVFLIIAGSANAVNLTDGLDGLAAGTSIISLFTLTAMAITIYVRVRGPGPLYLRIENRLDIAIMGAAVIGAAIGFLWFNAFPAEVFMGDTGSMALGGAIGAMAIVLKVELLLLLVGGIFVIEALSVVLQVVSFRWWGRRIFLMAPLHHHFEMKAWSETRIMVRFWIVSGILCAAGFALFYKYDPQIRPHYAPVVHTGRATRLTTTSATLTGSVNPDSEATTYSFQYGTTRSYGSQTAPTSAGSGPSAVEVSARLSGLRAGRSYHFRLVARNGSRTSDGSDATFALAGSRR
jgi:phospho-N-acetylmuramoyl-pentapeptide-transferase